MNEKIKEIVREVLKEDTKARDDDKWLIIQVLRKLGFDFYIDYRDLKDIPSFETITRCRRVIQNNEGDFIPSPIIDEKRAKHELKCREMYKNTNLTW